jgi:hypothetical protein
MISSLFYRFKVWWRGRWCWSWVLDEKAGNKNAFQLSIWYVTCGTYSRFPLASSLTLWLTWPTIDACGRWLLASSTNFWKSWLTAAPLFSSAVHCRIKDYLQQSNIFDRFVHPQRRLSSICILGKNCKVSERNEKKKMDTITATPPELPHVIATSPWDIGPKDKVMKLKLILLGHLFQRQYHIFMKTWSQNVG